jgi:hypothetical protein
LDLAPRSATSHDRKYFVNLPSRGIEVAGSCK